MFVDRNIAQKTNIVEIEKEINNKYHNTSHIKKEDLQIYIELNKDNLYPIEFIIDSYGYIKIKDNQNYTLKNIYIGSNKQFIYECYNISEEKTNILRLSNKFKTAWNANNYMIFRNGYLLNNSVYKLGIPSFDNFLAIKTIYTMVSFKNNDRIEVFYIENNDLMHDVPFNKDLILLTKKISATKNDQTIIKIPYPYESYPKDKKMFICFTKQGMYLDNRYDYTVSSDNEYITLKYENRLLSSYVDYLIFIFPYINSGYIDTDDEEILSSNESGIDIEYSFSILNTNSSEDGIVNFYPIFDKYELNKTNFILFGNSTFIDPDRYRIIDNGTIQFINKTDIQHSLNAKYIMAILKEQNITDNENLLFGLEYGYVEVEEDGQRKFKIPKPSTNPKSFLIFIGSINADTQNRFTWKQELDQLIITSGYDYLKKGKILNFIFYSVSDSNSNENNKEIVFKKMEWEIDKNEECYIPSNLHDNIQFNDSNLLLFINGTFIDPDRYQIDRNNKIIFVNNNDNPFENEKAVTGIYLVSYDSNSEKNNLDNYNMKEDNDWIWFDEMYSIPYESTNNFIEKDIDSNLFIEYKNKYLDLSSSINVFLINKSFNIDIQGSIEGMSSLNIEKDIEGTVSIINKTYTIYVTQPDNGVIKVNDQIGTEFTYDEGTIIKIQAFANEGYIVKNLYVDKISNNINAVISKEGE